MEIIINNWKLSLLIIGFLGISLLIGFKIFVYGMNKYFHYEMTWVLQKTVFKSYLIPIMLLYAFIILYIPVCLSLIYDNELKYLGYICLGITIFLLVKMYNVTKNSNLKIRENFKFQKYTTKVSYYNNQSQEYKIQCYNSIIDRIKRINFNTIDNQQYKAILIDDYLFNIESLITFEYFDAKIYNSISDHTTGVLFYSKFHKNLLEILSRINKITNNLQSIDCNYRAIIPLLLNIKYLRFDDNHGLNYNIDLLDIEVERLFIIKNEDASIEKGLTVINNSLENIQMVLDKNYSTTSENNKIIHLLEETVTEIKKIIFDNKKYRNSLKLKISLNKTITLFNGFVDEVLVTQNKQQLKKDLKDLFTFIADESIKVFPTTDYLTDTDIKYIMRFFSKYKDREFEYSVFDLQYLLTHFAKQPEKYKSSTIDQAHRNKMFDLDKPIQDKLNSLVR
ncbi:hypothetical protein [Chryseobacterium indoltheticum]|uniref:hypothetical protein n=1 Tax=Chryseobacterium indoltheticum TaxID=254 RepID=UPI0019145C25|nr:hypothetical protein [Chryseobacterium indoltheticum]QQQ29877.1 hypothetical protein JJL46_07700 [Chryseobacterium indoltheticum]